MATRVLNAVPPAAPRMRYASTLRCFGQLLEGMELKALEIKTHNDDYILQAWNKGTSMTMDLDKIFTPDDVHQLEVDGRAKRKPFSGPPNMLSLPQVLRLAGNYVDRQRGRLVRVSWQDQSDKIQSITVQWEASPAARESSDAQLSVIEELCIHIYKQRKKINLASERQGHRPFVSVGRANR
ncbi:MAG: hypothetical protein ACXWYD_05350 [Candidatus Binatia bacterium]